MVKRSLVTGGAGFIGHHLCRALTDTGHKVICLDDFTTGTMANVASLLPAPGFTFLKHDVTTPFACEVDDIYNLACPASPPAYQRDPIRTTRTNVLGAINALNEARRLGCPVLQASTSEVYGDPERHPQAEDYRGSVNPVGPRSCYDEGKRCAETLFMDYHRHAGVAVKIARIFNTYGPGMQADDGRVVSNFIVNALRGEPLVIHGDGTQTRSFCYVDDMVAALTALMASPATGPLNLGNPHEVSVSELAETVLGIVGGRSVIAYAPAVTDDPRRRCPDIGCAQRALQWQPRVALNDGLRETVRHFRRRLAV